ncbi:MAG: SDR family oxidoreductase [Lachnospiraceae bacterium]|nr:SDR family oxidoreductase [Lachnospiraceae bacterium]MDE6627535.1 SDR family oxidoreductase [Lachnospiraceae bacterium]
MEKYAVVTGASAGLGMEFARSLSAKGYRLILVARREKRLRKLAEQLKTECEVIEADLTKTEDCYRVMEAVQNRDVEIFINNAGFGEYGRFTETSLDKEMDMIDLNVRAVHLFTKLMLRRMIQKDCGYILNVASCAGLMPAGPYMTAYYATKAYVVSLTRAVAEELRENGSHVYVGCLCPGPVNTEFNRVANVEFQLKGISPRYCVRYGLKQMRRKKVVIVPTLPIKLAMTFGRLLPGSVYVKISASQQRKKSSRI